MKTILFLPTNKDWGGSELLWSRAALVLAHHSDLRVLIYKSLSLKLPEYITSIKRIEVFQKNRRFGSEVVSLINRVVPYRFRLKRKNHFISVLRLTKPDLVVVNQGFNFNGVKEMEICLTMGIKFVSISQAVCEHFWPDIKFRERLKLVFSKSAGNYFVSLDNLLTTESQIATRVNNKKVVRNPVNKSVISGIKFPDLNEVYRLAVVGRIHFASKGQDVLLRALNNPVWKDRNLEINIYGEGPDETNLVELINFYNLHNFVHYKGYEKPEIIWSQNQGLLLTSRYEGLPIVIAEAMFARRMVIVTDVSGNSELVIPDITGIIIEAPRPNSIDAALEKAWGFRDNWKEMGEKAGEQIGKVYPADVSQEFANGLIQLI